MTDAPGPRDARRSLGAEHLGVDVIVFGAPGAELRRLADRYGRTLSYLHASAAVLAFGTRGLR